MKKSHQIAEPWYKFPMVWMVFGLPAIVVIASIYTIIIAHQSPPVLIAPSETKTLQADSSN